MNWTLTIGLYPGMLIGFRSYNEEDYSIHVLYLPFVDIALTLFND